MEIDILSIGEVIVDLVSNLFDRTEELDSYKIFAGGSCVNLVLWAAKLGCQTAFIGKTGNDFPAEFVAEKLTKAGVITDGLIKDKSSSTSLLLISKQQEKTYYTPYRQADTLLNFSEIKSNISLVDKAKIVHSSAMSIAFEPCREAVLQSLGMAKAKGKLVSFDPNVTGCLGRNQELWKDLLRQVYQHAIITKPSLKDAVILWGKDTPQNYLEAYHSLGARIVVLTLGEEGCLVSKGSLLKHVVGKKAVVKDPTGAGDAFWAGFLSGILTNKNWEESAQMGNQSGAEAVQILGGAPKV